MASLTPVLFLLGAVAYAIAGALCLRGMSVPQGEGRAAAVWAWWSLAFGGATHLAYELSSSLVRRRCPLLELDSALGLSAVVVVLVVLVVGRGRLRPLGAFAAPLALAVLVAAEFVAPTPPVVDQQLLLAVHVATNLVGFGVFLVAGLLGALYLRQDRRLKAKRPAPLLARGPSLEVLDGISHRLVLLGFPLLSIGIVTGAAFSARLVLAEPLEIARAVIAYLGWGVVAAALLLRSLAGWRGRRAAWAAVVGAGCLLLVVAGYVLQAMLGGRA